MFSFGDLCERYKVPSGFSGYSLWVGKSQAAPRLGNRLMSKDQTKKKPKDKKAVGLNRPYKLPYVIT